MTFWLSELSEIVAVGYSLRASLKMLKLLSQSQEATASNNKADGVDDGKGDNDNNVDSGVGTTGEVEGVVQNEKQIMDAAGTLMFWTIFALYLIWEKHFEFLIRWFPGYYYAKAAFIMTMALTKLRITHIVFYDVLVPGIDWIYAYLRLNELGKISWRELLLSLPIYLFLLIFPVHLTDDQGMIKRRSSSVMSTLSFESASSSELSQVGCTYEDEEDKVGYDVQDTSFIRQDAIVQDDDFDEDAERLSIDSIDNPLPSKSHRKDETGGGIYNQEKDDYPLQDKESIGSIFTTPKKAVANSLADSSRASHSRPTSYLTSSPSRANPHPNTARSPDGNGNRSRSRSRSSSRSSSPPLSPAALRHLAASQVIDSDDDSDIDEGFLNFFQERVQESSRRLTTLLPAIKEINRQSISSLDENPVSAGPRVKPITTSTSTPRRPVTSTPHTGSWTNGASETGLPSSSKRGDANGVRNKVSSKMFGSPTFYSALSLARKALSPSSSSTSTSRSKPSASTEAHGTSRVANVIRSSFSSTTGLSSSSRSRSLLSSPSTSTSKLSPHMENISPSNSSSFPPSAPPSASMSSSSSSSVQSSPSRVSPSTHVQRSAHTPSVFSSLQSLIGGKSNGSSSSSSSSSKLDEGRRVSSLFDIHHPPPNSVLRDERRKSMFMQNYHVKQASGISESTSPNRGRHSTLLASTKPSAASSLDRSPGIRSPQSNLQSERYSAMPGQLDNSSDKYQSRDRPHLSHSPLSQSMGSPADDVDGYLPETVTLRSRGSSRTPMKRK